jgi:hypothetical protein
MPPTQEIQVVRIDMSTAGDLDQAISDTCTVRHNAGYRLASSFILGSNLVLIFEAQ